MPYRQVSDGEWVTPVMDGYKMACCDCKLVHRLDFRVITEFGDVLDDVIVQFRAFRDKRATAQRRRKAKT